MTWVASIISTVGLIILSQSLTFGWYRKDAVEFSSHTQSVCLFLAGMALMFTGIFVRQVLVKLGALEKELKQLISVRPI